MRKHQLAWLCGFVILALGSPAVAAPKWSSGGPPGPPARVMTTPQGRLFCPSTAFVFGQVVISSGRCYLLSVLRDSRGTFLAFLPPDARIPPGQLVRLNTPAGPKLRGRIFYLVPIQGGVTLPLNSITVVTPVIQYVGSNVAIVVTGPYITNQAQVVLIPSRSSEPPGTNH